MRMEGGGLQNREALNTKHVEACRKKTIKAPKAELEY